MNVSKNPAGHTDCDATCFGEKISMDFNFTRASSVKYKKRKGMSRVVKSRQGYRTTLTIVDRKTRKLFVFPTADKSHNPIEKIKLEKDMGLLY